MLLLVSGLLLFLGTHSTRIFAEAWRGRMIDRVGPLVWKGAYSLISLAGLVLIVQGYGQARLAPVELWSATTATRHIASLLTLAAFVLLVAAYVPRNRIRQRLRHPMVLGVKLWAFAHLLSNGNLADVLLFGSVLAWAVMDFRSARGRDRQAGAAPALSGSLAMDLITVALGLFAWWAFAVHLHARWIGVSPMG